MQDVDRTQLRLALLLAAPANRIFAVGDDDQTLGITAMKDRRVGGSRSSRPATPQRQVGLSPLAEDPARPPALVASWPA
jgi:hypothetical protein